MAVTNHRGNGPTTGPPGSAISLLTRVLLLGLLPACGSKSTSECPDLPTGSECEGDRVRWCEDGDVEYFDCDLGCSVDEAGVAACLSAEGDSGPGGDDSANDTEDSGTDAGRPTGEVNISDPSVYSSFLHGEYGEGTGTAVLLVDLTGDGQPDGVVGDPYAEQSDGGQVRAATGPLLGDVDIQPWYEHVEWYHDWDDGHFGWGLAAGDLDGDGQVDLVTSSPRHGSSTDVWGETWVLYSPAIGTPDDEPVEVTGMGSAARVYRYDSSSDDGRDLGLGGLTVADMDADGREDLVVSAVGYWATGSGSVYVVPGDIAGTDQPVENAATMEVTTDANGYKFGTAVAVGDLTGSGTPELVVSQPYCDASERTRAGLVYIFGYSEATIDQSASRAVIAGTNWDGNLGGGLAIGDLNGDGFADLVVSEQQAADAQLANGLRVRFGPVPDGASEVDDDAALLIGLDRFDASGGDPYSVAIDLPGDLDGDGSDDIVIGFADSDLGGPDAGLVAVAYGPFSGSRALDTDSLQIVGYGDYDNSHAGDAYYCHQALGADIAHGDGDGDGVIDLLIGSPLRAHSHCGDKAPGAYLISGQYFLP